jgi:hypothetical protein
MTTQWNSNADWIFKTFDRENHLNKMRSGILRTEIETAKKIYSLSRNNLE